jgi:hypothetical protein
MGRWRRERSAFFVTATVMWSYASENKIPSGRAIGPSFSPVPEVNVKSKHNEPFRRRSARQRILAKVWSTKDPNSFRSFCWVMIQAYAEIQLPD